MSSTLKPQGKSHRVLAFLAQGPALMEEIWRAAGIDGADAKERKCVYLLTALRDEGLVTHCGTWAITPAGQAALDALNAGRVVTSKTPTSARQFRRPAA